MKKKAARHRPRKLITVLLAENHPAFRRSLKLLIESEGDIKVVAEARNGIEALKLAVSAQPDVLVMDIGMPLLNGLQATRQVMDSSSHARVLILSAQSDPAYIKQAMIFGASGYLIKQSSTHQLMPAIREVLKGKTFFSLAISQQVREQCQRIFGKFDPPGKRGDFEVLLDRKSPIKVPKTKSSHFDN
jgi:DNA-binding NarL/FixJ family response regulator